MVGYAKDSWAEGVTDSEPRFYPVHFVLGIIILVISENKDSSPMICHSRKTQARMLSDYLQKLLTELKKTALQELLWVKHKKVFPQ
jgi:hypothetical protein